MHVSIETIALNERLRCEGLLTGDCLVHTQIYGVVAIGVDSNVVGGMCDCHVRAGLQRFDVAATIRQLVTIDIRVVTPDGQGVLLQVQRVDEVLVRDAPGTVPSW